MRCSTRSPLVGKTNFSSLKTWLLTWRSLPVFSWIRAAELYRLGRFAEAAQFYRKGLDRHPNHPAKHCAMIDLARCLYADGKIGEAEQYLRQLVTKIPHSRTAHTTLFLLQLRSGQLLDAAWTMRRACRYIVPEPELIGLYLFCVVENGGPNFLLKEALQFADSTEGTGKGTPLMRAGRLRLKLERNGYPRNVLKELETLSDEHVDDVELSLLAADALLRGGKIASARRLLRTALQNDPTHPRVLSLFAETYLLAGSFYNPQFALQLASEACKRSGWKSPREMHILAEVFFHLGDTLSALATAERARQEGTRLLGTYRDASALERLISTLREDLKSDQQPQT